MIARPLNPYPTYADIQIGCHRIVNKIMRDGVLIDCVMGLVRGGLVPATIISHIMDVPMITATYSSHNGAGQRKHNNHLPNIPNILGNLLIVDDICDSGYTLSEVSLFYQKDYPVKTAAIYNKRNLNYTPDYFMYSIGEDSPYITFPWEV